ncbi:MAG: hypothetical protein BGO90_04090 [Legionella sp. 40-6]|nr:HAD family phosphatase [Legionella sp.]OJY07902.1 MAG: hypothetical protein BGO90_04090 [Legionella sp. 40-6]
MIKAFLFDLDGTLFDTHPVYFKTIMQILLSTKKKHNLDVLLPVPAELMLEIRDKPFAEAQQIIFERYPVFLPYSDEMSDLFYQILAEEFTYSKNHFIEASIEVLLVLLQQGKKIAVATNSPNRLSRLLLNQINVSVAADNTQNLQPGEVYLITADECNGAVKPDPTVYQHALKVLDELAEDCLAIEDSTRGLVAARLVNLPVVLLRTEFSKDAGSTEAVEIVASLNESEILKSYLNEQKSTLKSDNDISLCYYRWDELEDKVKKQLVTQTYAVYRNLFVGRNINQWQELFYDPQQADLLIFIARNSQQEIVGFYIISAFKINFQKSERLVLKLYMGVLPAYQPSGIVPYAFSQASHFFLKKYPDLDIDIFENITGPVAYAHACRFFKEYLQPTRHNKYSSVDKLYLRHLLKLFHYHAHNPEDEYIIESQSGVFINTEQYHRLQNSNNADIQFFIEKTGLNMGVGLACLIKAKPGLFSNRMDDLFKG